MGGFHLSIECPVPFLQVGKGKRAPCNQYKDCMSNVWVKSSPVLITGW